MHNFLLPPVPPEKTSLPSYSLALQAELTPHVKVYLLQDQPNLKETYNQGIKVQATSKDI